MDHQPDELAITLPGEPASVPALRARVRRALEEAAVVPAVAEDALVVVSELATTAVLHAPARFTVRLRFGGGHVRVEVHHNALTSRSPLAEPDFGEGRQVSLAVLAGLAEVGHSIDPDGSLLWAEVGEPPCPTEMSK